MIKRKNILKIAIDSPAAAGAGTLAKAISKHYGLFYLDTGKIYRFIAYLKLKYHKNFNLGKFSFDNTAMFQNVNQDEMVLNVPKFIFRNSFYITEKIFNNVLDIQSGFNFKIFSSFYANEYNPLISSFDFISNSSCKLIIFFSNRFI